MFLDVSTSRIDTRLLAIVLIYADLRKFSTVSLDSFFENYELKVKVITFIKIIAIQLPINLDTHTGDIFAHSLRLYVSLIKRLFSFSELRKKMFSQ